MDECDSLHGYANHQAERMTSNSPPPIAYHSSCLNSDAPLHSTDPDNSASHSAERGCPHVQWYVLDRRGTDRHDSSSPTCSFSNLDAKKKCVKRSSTAACKKQSCGVDANAAFDWSVDAAGQGF